MKIVIIGSGNLATQLSLALKDAGADIVQVYSPTESHARQLAEKIGCGYTSRIEVVRSDADVFLLSIKDDAISEVASALCQQNREALFLHTAGSVAMSVFSPYAIHYGVLYPMQTFSKNRRVDFHCIPCFIEASDAQALTTTRLLAESVSDNVVAADSERRKKLHLAAVLACNLTNHCYRLAERVLEGEETDFRLLLPLIEETARKVRELSPREAQTGPMVRYDRGIMALQLGMLPDERTRQIYRLMAESIHEDSKLRKKE